MKHIHDIIRDRLERIFPVVRDANYLNKRLTELEKSEWSPEFEKLMRNRLLMGALRYGLLADKKKGHVKWNLLGALTAKIENYEKTGNTEYLVDAANYCLLAFECDDHPTKHFKALDDHTDHCKVKLNTEKRK